MLPLPSGNVLLQYIRPVQLYPFIFFDFPDLVHFT
jgi:hypothetical protein